MTDKLRAAAQQALEALEMHVPHYIVRSEYPPIVALRDALAEQPAEQSAKHGEPVAWLNPYGGVLQQPRTGLERSTYTIPLYTAPQPAKPAEPVAWMWKDGTLTSDPDRADGTWTPLYTAPQPAKQCNCVKRVPLTDDEIDALELPPSGTATVRDLVRLIERAHGITGETK